MKTQRLWSRLPPVWRHKPDAPGWEDDEALSLSLWCLTGVTGRASTLRKVV